MGLRQPLQVLFIVVMLYHYGLLVSMNYALLMIGFGWLYYRQTCLPKTGERS